MHLDRQVTGLGQERTNPVLGEHRQEPGIAGVCEGHSLGRHVERRLSPMREDNRRRLDRIHDPGADVRIAALVAAACADERAQRAQ